MHGRLWPSRYFYRPTLSILRQGEALGWSRHLSRTVVLELIQSYIVTNESVVALPTPVYIPQSRATVTDSDLDTWRPWGWLPGWLAWRAHSLFVDLAISPEHPYKNIVPSTKVRP